MTAPAPPSRGASRHSAAAADAPSSPWRWWRWPALRTALIVFAFSALWIVFSDRFVNSLGLDAHAIALMQTYKGLCFMLLNAGLIYLLISRDLRRLRQTEFAYVASQAALRRERDFTTSIIETANAMIVVLDPRGRIVQFNRTAVELTGSSSEDALGRIFWEAFIPGEDGPLVMQALTRIQSHRGPLEFESRVRHAGGALRLMAWRCANLFDAAGAFEGIILIGVDISAQRLSERELADSHTRLERQLDTQTRQLDRSERLFRRVFDSAFDGILIMSAGMEILDVNQGISRMLGAPREELIHLSIAEIFSPGALAGFREAATLLCREASPVFLQTSLRAANGAAVPVEAGGVHLTLGGEGCMVWSFRDISARLRAEEEITKLSAAVRQSPSMIVIAGTNGAIQYVNPRFEFISGHAADSLLGEPLSRVIAGPGSPATFATIWREIEGGRSWRGEARSLRKNGEPYWQQMSISPVVSDAGEFTHVVLVAEEITEKKTADLALRQFADELAQKTADLNDALAKEMELRELRTRFIAMVSHEFRTPLTTIQAASDILQRYNDKLTPAERNGRLDKIQDQVQLMTRLLEDVLILGEGEAAFKPAPRLVPLNAILKEIIENTQSVMPPGYDLKFNIRLDRDDLTIDENLARQVFINLLTNAIKYSPGGGNVFFSVVCVNQMLNAVVQDEGKGIPESDLPHIFSPFHRGGNVENIPGTGLGLTIVKQAVERHNGTISVRSRLGHGSIFNITIPLGPA